MILELTMGEIYLDFSMLHFEPILSEGILAMLRDAQDMYTL